MDKTPENKPTEDRDVRLEAILDYEMDELEGKAYKLCLLWIDRSRKVFPEYQHTGMKKVGPRRFGDRYNLGVRPRYIRRDERASVSVVSATTSSVSNIRQGGASIKAGWEFYSTYRW